MDQVPTMAAILVSPQSCAILAAGEPGTVVRLFRVERGWTQQELANRAGWSQSTISRIEEGKTRAAHDMDVLAALAQALDIPRATLGLATTSDQGRTLDTMHRREVLGNTLALAVSALLPHGVATASRITAADLTQCWTAERRLHELDATQGGAPVFQLAAGLTRRLQEALRGGSYPAPVGRELHQVTALTAQKAGWLAYDAGWEQQARRWWLETCHLADLNDVPEARVRALATIDATVFPRNHVLLTVRLGSVLTQIGQLDEAINLTSRAIHGVHTIRGSGRTLTDLRQTLDLLGRQNHPPARSFATAAHRLLPTAA